MSTVADLFALAEDLERDHTPGDLTLHDDDQCAECRERWPCWSVRSAAFVRAAAAALNQAQAREVELMRERDQWAARAAHEARKVLVLTEKEQT